MRFLDRLDKAFRTNQSLLCVGLDPDPELMPVSNVLSFNRAIIDATANSVCAYKPNLAFYEALGIAGLKALEGTVAHIRSVAPDVLVIGDSKRGDVGSTSRKYAQAMFDVWGFDATTVNAYGGGESIDPFLERKDKGIIIWCRSSNPGASEFQDQSIAGTDQALFEHVAKAANSWNHHGNVCLVVGATYPEQLATIRELSPDLPILLPGIGAQGGDLQASVKAGVDVNGRNLMVSSSRGILYASDDPKTFGQAAATSARKLRDSINTILDEDNKGWRKTTS
ncbi:MAG: orotidine-5'-phosphate decarboxylase [Chloroflexi bacterium]|nr:orotidine-5'-phosphate decarboxylase [Chloroflexota bacterium]